MSFLQTLLKKDSDGVIRLLQGETTTMEKLKNIVANVDADKPDLRSSLEIADLFREYTNSAQTMPVGFKGWHDADYEKVATRAQQLTGADKNNFFEVKRELACSLSFCAR